MVTDSGNEQIDIALNSLISQYLNASDWEESGSVTLVGNFRDKIIKEVVLGLTEV